jgi:hypothetical protein
VQSLLLVSVIFAIAYVLSRPIFSTRWSLYGFRRLFLSGLEFLFLGYLLGPHGLDLLPQVLLDAIDPLIHLALSWAGFVFGLQFNRRMLAVYRPRRYAVAFFQAILTAVLVGICGVWIARHGLGLAVAGDPLRVGLILGICAASTAPVSLHYFSRIFRLRGRVNRLLKFVAAVDAIPAVIALGLAGGVFYEGTRTSATSPWSLMLLTIALGVVFGLLTSALAGLDLSRSELLVIVLGMLILGSGAARVLEVSTVFVSALAGFIVANAAWNREEVHKVAVHVEKPIYLSFLFLAGTVVTIDDWRVPAFAGALALLRIAGKVLGNMPWRWVASEPEARSFGLGLALASQGPLTLVLALDIEFLHRGSSTTGDGVSLVISSIVVAVVLSELVSPLLIRLVAPPGELGRRRASR